jgi:hypothetical protein
MKMNISFLCKWWWRLEKEQGVWQDIVKAKYLQHNGVRSVKHRIDDSPVWTDLLKIKHIYLSGRKIETKNWTKNTMRWHDAWLEEKPICIIAPVLYDLCRGKNITVHQFLLAGGHIL